MKPQYARALAGIGSIACLLAAAYCFFWIISAASLASGYCGDRFSLFAAEFRCRQAHVAAILSFLFGSIGLYLAWRASRR